MPDILRWFTGSKAPAADPAENVSPPPASPLARLNRDLCDLEATVNQFATAFRLLQEQIAVVRKCAGLAWQDREAMQAEYYAAIRDILRVLDDAQLVEAAAPQTQPLCDALRRLVRQQRIEPLGAAEGDPFQSELHECESTVAAPQHRPGTIVRVLEKGYVRTLNDGSMAIVRPARVIVSQSESFKEP
jgi:molecular chaperone GrpE (heat shock protein)